MTSPHGGSCGLRQGPGEGQSGLGLGSGSWSGSALLRKGDREMLLPRKAHVKASGWEQHSRWGNPTHLGVSENEVWCGEQGELEDSVWRELRQRGGRVLAPKMKEPTCHGHTARKQKPAPGQCLGGQAEKGRAPEPSQGPSPQGSEPTVAGPVGQQGGHIEPFVFPARKQLPKRTFQDVLKEQDEDEDPETKKKKEEEGETLVGREEAVERLTLCVCVCGL